MRKPLIYFMIAVIGCACSLTSPSDEGKRYHLQGTLEKGTDIDITINTVAFDASRSGFEDPLWWGTELKPPTNIVARFSLEMAGEKRSIRHSAYSDLTNIKGATMKISGNDFEVTLEGGSTATHYFAHLFFDDQGYLVRRKVYHSVFRDEVWEETEYSYIRRQDMW